MTFYNSKITMKSFIKIVFRIFEIISASILLLVLSPFFLLAVILVQLDSPGPIIFKQKRVGKDGKVFTLYKLRTMKKGANGSVPPHTQLNDPRFSKLCHIIRSTGIDEVPQLWNIIKGDMGFVGPRPELPSVVKTYTSRQRQVLKYRPGLLGISQLALREGVDYRKKLELENFYYPRRSAIKDFAIVVLTPIVLLDNTIRKFLPNVPRRAEYTNTIWLKLVLGRNGLGVDSEKIETAKQLGGSQTSPLKERALK